MTMQPNPNQLTLLDQIPRTCTACGGVVLSPTMGGVPRGTCHCSPKQIVVTKLARSAPRECCGSVIAVYERDYPHAERAKAFGVAACNPGSYVGLYCEACVARLEYDGRWVRIGGAP